MQLRMSLFYRVCKLGDRAVPYPLVHDHDGWHCHKNSTKLYNAYCSSNGTCDAYFNNNELQLIKAVPGFSLNLMKGRSNVYFVLLRNG